MIRTRAGHGELSTIQRYVGEAESIQVNAGEPFSPLPACLWHERGSGGRDLSGTLLTIAQSSEILRSAGLSTWMESEGIDAKNRARAIELIHDNA